MRLVVAARLGQVGVLAAGVGDRASGDDMLKADGSVLVHCDGGLQAAELQAVLFGVLARSACLLIRRDQALSPFPDARYANVDVDW